MTHAGDEDPDYADRIAASAQAHKGAWQRTLDDMEVLAEELESEGWDTVTIGAGHTAPEHPDAGDTDRFGMVYVIPGNKAEPFSEAIERGTYPQFEVFQQEVDGRVFIVTLLKDPESKTAILLAGNFELRNGVGLVRAAKREAKMYTHVQKLDTTVLGTFEHDDWEPFFPEPERYESYHVEAQIGVDEDDA